MSLVCCRPCVRFLIFLLPLHTCTHLQPSVPLSQLCASLCLHSIALLKLHLSIILARNAIAHHIKEVREVWFQQPCAFADLLLPPNGIHTPSSSSHYRTQRWGPKPPTPPLLQTLPAPPSAPCRAPKYTQQHPFLFFPLLLHTFFSQGEPPQCKVDMWGILFSVQTMAGACVCVLKRLLVYKGNHF